LLRFVIRAQGNRGGVRHCPAATDLHPTFSCATYLNTNHASIAFLKALTFGRLQRPGGSRRVQALAEESLRPPWATRLDWGNTAIILPPGSSNVLVFDHVRMRQRKGGYKVDFQPDRPWGELRAVNLIFESSPRYVLAEPLAFELYRRAGVPAPATDHVRLWVDQRPLGYHLLVEQPNRAFFRRLGRDPDGNLYKLLWYGQGVTGQHEKKTNPRTGYADLEGAVEALNQTSGSEQWDFIRQHFDVDELASYFAVNMCIQNWDGFFNNYYAYHDPRPGGKWQIVPWDEDKTWGDHDGASPAYDWYEMPLTYGMKGDRPPHPTWFGMWPVGGAEWWRPPGHFSGPLLANPQFRQRFLARLRELCETVFTAEAFGPTITALEQRLAPEPAFRAQLQRQDPAIAQQRFHRDIESFRRQIAHRRQFILKQLESTSSSRPTSAVP
jgi:spore coat protein H